MEEFYREGDHLVVCDQSGQKVLRSQCVRQWDGMIVKKEYADCRHPLDRPFSPRPERAIHDARPPGEPIFIEPGDVTANDL